MLPTLGKGRASLLPAWVPGGAPTAEKKGVCAQKLLSLGLGRRRCLLPYIHPKSEGPFESSWCEASCPQEKRGRDAPRGQWTHGVVDAHGREGLCLDFVLSSPSIPLTFLILFPSVNPQLCKHHLQDLMSRYFPYSPLSSTLGDSMLS